MEQYSWQRDPLNSGNNKSRNYSSPQEESSNYKKTSLNPWHFLIKHYAKIGLGFIVIGVTGFALSAFDYYWAVEPALIISVGVGVLIGFSQFKKTETTEEKPTRNTD